MREPQETWIVEFWKLARVLLLDLAIFLVILAGLLIAYEFLRLFQAAGYDSDKIKTLENVHFYIYLPIQILLGVDLFMKFFSLTIGRKSG
jgi:hypothetical protein